MDSNRLAGVREQSVVIGFELGRWDVTEVAVEAFGVVPVHPAERRELDIGDGLPRPLTGPTDELGLVEAVHRFRERVVVAVTDRPDRRDRAEFGEAFAVTDARELAAGIGVTPQSFELGGIGCISSTMIPCRRK